MSERTKTKAKHKFSLTTQILLALVFGAVVGFIIRAMPQVWQLQIDKYFVSGVLQPGGAIFINLMKMLVVPIVFVSLICGVCSLDNFKALGRISLKTLFWFLVTTVIALVLALVFANIFKVGIGTHLPYVSGFTQQKIPSLREFIIGIFPSNPVAALANANMLQIIVFAILFGLSINLACESGKRIAAWFNDVNVILIKLIMMLMYFAPIGVFCLISILFAKMGWQLLLQLLNYFLVTVFVLVIHTIFAYSFLLRGVAGLNPLIFFRKMYGLILFAIGVSSSNASLPLALETVETKLGVKKIITTFVISLGINMNKNGTAIMQGVATVFIANAYGVPLNLMSYLVIIVTATLATLGTAGAPSIGVLMLVIVLKQVGLPIEGIALILGIDRLLDMLRTAVNVTGNAVVACIVGKSEKELDINVYNNCN